MIEKIISTVSLVGGYILGLILLPVIWLVVIILSTVDTITRGFTTDFSDKIINAISDIIRVKR